jgi:hypothetical protein
MDIQDIMRRLHESTYLREMAHVTEFQGERINADGEEVPVTVAILDYGTDDPEARYRVVAEDIDGATVEGDAAASVEEAIEAVTWSEFVTAEEDEYGEDEGS